MIDAYMFSLLFTSSPCETNRSKLTAPWCLPNTIRPSWKAHKTARIAQHSPRNAHPGRDLMSNAKDNKTA